MELPKKFTPQTLTASPDQKKIPERGQRLQIKGIPLQGMRKTAFDQNRYGFMIFLELN